MDGLLVATLSLAIGAPLFDRISEVGDVFFQVSSAANYLGVPFLLIPAIYARLRDVDDRWKITALVYSLLLPTLITLVVARAFGTPVSDAKGTGYRFFEVYRLGACDVVLTRTQVGFALAACACAAFAVVLSRAAATVRLSAATALAISAGLFAMTGGIGSMVSAFVGMSLMLVVGRKHLSSSSLIKAIAALSALGFAGHAWSPAELVDYTAGRYAERFTGRGVEVADRVALWSDSFSYLLEHPTGIGWGLFVDSLSIYPHNDYLTYGIGFGVLAGVVYAVVPLILLAKFTSRLRQPMLSDDCVTLNLIGIGVAASLAANSMSDHLTANRWYYNVVWSLIWYTYFAGLPTRATARRPPR